jgi:hypothetical protein
MAITDTGELARSGDQRSGDSSGLRPRIGWALAAGAAALLLSWGAHSLVPLFAAQVLATALTLSARVGRTVALSWSVLVSTAGLAALAGMGWLLGTGLHPIVTGLVLLVVLMGAMLVRVPAPRLSWRGAAWGALAGPLLLLVTAGFYAVVWGPVPAWAMSGDSRNHYLMTGVIQSEGWRFFDGYPALNNAVTAALQIPASGVPSGTSVILGVQTMAQVLLLFLCLLGLAAGLLAAGNGVRGPAAQLRAAAGSGIAVSPFVLSMVLFGGFHPIPLTILILISSFTVLLVGRPGPLGALVVMGLATVLLARIFPVAATLPSAVLVGQWAHARISRPTVARFVQMGALLIGYLAILLLLLRFLDARESIVIPLTQEGGIAHRGPELLGGVLILAIVSWSVHRVRPQAGALLVVTFATLTLGVVAWWLVDLRGFLGYYAAKTLWIGTAALLPAALARVGDPSSPALEAVAGPSGTESGRAPSDTVKRALAPVLIFGFLTVIPKVFGTHIGSETVNNSLNAIAQGWLLPNTEAARVLQHAGDTAGESYFWGVFDAETDRRIDIWSTAVRFPSGRAELGDRVATWAYSGDVVAPPMFCAFLLTDPASQVWTRTPAQADELARTCRVAATRVRPIPPEWFSR